MRNPNQKNPSLVVAPNMDNACVAGWDDIAARLREAIVEGRNEKPILVVECYPGVDEMTVLNELKSRLNPPLVIHAAEAYLPSAKIDALVAPSLISNDPASGFFSNLSLVHFFHAEPLWRFRRIIEDFKEGLILIVGCGASLIAWGHILVYADLPRREAQKRIQQSESKNLGAENKTIDASERYKRAFFVDWRMADRWKRPLIVRWDFVLDTSDSREPKLADAEAVREGFHFLTKRPLRILRLSDDAVPNSIESFNLVPEETSLLLGFGDQRIELPLLDLFFSQARAVLGDFSYARFGDEFPIRFNTQSRSIYFKHADAKGHWKRATESIWMNSFKPLSRGDGWREEKSKLAECDFIQLRRRWFTKKVSHRTHDTAHLICLVHGKEVIVESPTNGFEPLVIRQSETFIVPAAVGEYTIRPRGASDGKECATLKMFVRA